MMKFIFGYDVPKKISRPARDTTRRISSPGRRRASWISGKFPGVVAFVLVLLAASPVRAQITTNTALPVTKGEAIIRLQTKFIRSTGDSTPMDRDLQVLAFPLVGVYGVTPKVTLFGVIPILDKNLEVTTPMGRVTRNTTGLADARVFARYTLFQFNRHGQLIRLAPFSGVELPTGTDGVTDNLGRLPQPLQLGSGSWDPFVGLVFTRQTFAWQIDASASYQYNTKANNFQFGDLARLDLATKVRLLPRHLGRGLPSFLYANLESNLIWQDQNEIGGAVDRNSGGVTWYLAPGLQYATRRIIFEAAVQLPVVQNLNGTALENNAIVTLSTRISI